MMRAAAINCADGDGFTREESAEQDGDNRIHIRVSGDFRRIAVTQQPNVSRIPDHGTDDYEINK